MIKNIVYKLQPVISDQQIEDFFYEMNDCIRNVVRCVERMIQDYVGILMQPTSIKFTSDNPDEFPYMPIIKVEKHELVGVEEWNVEYKCGLLDASPYYSSILLISFDCYTSKKLLTMNEIQQYLMWFPGKKSV
jgi:hypothetical protein